MSAFDTLPPMPREHRLNAAGDLRQIQRVIAERPLDGHLDQRFLNALFGLAQLLDASGALQAAIVDLESGDES